MKIAFASCFDALSMPEQRVWQRVRQEQPDVLLLLGDSIYMDFFPHLYQSKKWPPQQFADEMYKRYAAQWQVPGFRELLASVQRVGAVWDDHDYAWNQSHGAGAIDKTFVRPEHRRIARALFSDFRAALNSPAEPYPPQPPLQQMLDGPDTGVQASFDFGPARFILLDGRTQRTEQRDDATGELHGQQQLDWFKHLVQTTDRACIVASGSTLSHSKESWDNYRDYEWLMQQKLPRLLVLSGDIHSNKPRQHKLDGYRLCEATSSGAARRGLGGARDNFGIVKLEGLAAEVQWFADHEPEPETVKSWTL